MSAERVVRNGNEFVMVDTSEISEKARAEYDINLADAKLELADLAVQEAEAKASHKAAKEAFDTQRERVIEMLDRGPTEPEPDLFEDDHVPQRANA